MADRRKEKTWNCFGGKLEGLRIYIYNSNPSPELLTCHLTGTHDTSRRRREFPKVDTDPLLMKERHAGFFVLDPYRKSLSSGVTTSGPYGLGTPGAAVSCYMYEIAKL